MWGPAFLAGWEPPPRANLLHLPEKSTRELVEIERFPIPDFIPSSFRVILVVQVPFFEVAGNGRFHLLF